MNNRLAKDRHGGLSLALPDVVHRYKSWTTKSYSDGVKQNGWEPFPGRLWQQNYYERIIRNGDELNRIREYIVCNPRNWAIDEENPENMAANKKLHGTSP